MTVVSPPPPERLVPSACYSRPVAPQDVDRPELEPLPPANAPAYWAVRTRNAERAGLYYQGAHAAVSEAYEVNAAAQARCAGGLADTEQ